nr:hypothetical protein KPHV_29750 [Kitasatospora purpeofusca]
MPGIELSSREWVRVPRTWLTRVSATSSSWRGGFGFFFGMPPRYWGNSAPLERFSAPGGPVQGQLPKRWGGLPEPGRRSAAVAVITSRFGFPRGNLLRYEIWVPPGEPMGSVLGTYEFPWGNPFLSFVLPPSYLSPLTPHGWRRGGPGSAATGSPAAPG